MSDDQEGSTPPAPPFSGIIETTLDALLVFEASRRGIIPRITRRLAEKERGMIQSGAVFVFDEGESGIKRWTDGLYWSRILSNFLVYRETDKRADRHNPLPNVASELVKSDDPEVIAAAARMSEKARERQLVGSLTTTYKFKEKGLVKKTISVSINGVAQHMVSYYSMEDALSGRLRSPSSLPELFALDISPDYLSNKHFRFPPKVEIGPDGVHRYRFVLSLPFPVHRVPGSDATFSSPR
ncbi:Gti1/Pac2 family-domain-containing protein [Mrakia frigida]|uniref:Gti1/Pac2 family protein n=1 Tax=Mrakia frigida TaxID=29902 RepID=UPI003FCC24B5